MSATLAELLAATTSDDVLTTLLARLQDKSFPTTDWSALGPERAILEIVARGQADLSAALPLIAKGGLIDLAEGDWLTLLAHYVYERDRNAASRTTGRYRLTNASTSAYTIVVGSFWVKGTATGNLYRASALPNGATLGASSTLDIEVESEFPNDSDAGLNYTDTPETLTDIVTPLPGVAGAGHNPDFSDVVHVGSSEGTVTPDGTVAAHSWVVKITLSGVLGTAKFKVSKNGGSSYGAEQTTDVSGAYGPDADVLELTFDDASGAAPFALNDTYSFTSPGSWIISQGTDEESDASLRIRCKARWPQLSGVPTLFAYEGMTRDASALVTRVKVATSTTINNVVNVTIAGQAGPVASDLINQVQAYLDARCATGDRPVVASASGTAITLAGTARVRRGFKAAAQAAAQTLLSAYLLADVEMGGEVSYEQLVELLMQPDGMVDLDSFTLNGSAADLTLAATNVPTWGQAIASALTWIEV